MSKVVDNSSMCHDVGHITWPGCGQKYSSSDQIVYKKHQACPSCVQVVHVPWPSLNTGLDTWFISWSAANCCMLSGQTWKPIGHQANKIVHKLCTDPWQACREIKDTFYSVAELQLWVLWVVKCAHRINYSEYSKCSPVEIPTLWSLPCTNYKLSSHWNSLWWMRCENQEIKSCHVLHALFEVHFTLSQLVRGQCSSLCTILFLFLSAQWVSKFGHSACNNWPHPGNEPSVQTSVQAWSWHMHNLYATWTCLMFFVHYLIAARILLATTRPCDVSNIMAHAWIVHYFTHASRAIFSQQ